MGYPNHHIIWHYGVGHVAPFESQTGFQAATNYHVRVMIHILKLTSNFFDIFWWRLLAACLLACCLLACLLKCVPHPWTLRRVVKLEQGKPSSVIKTYDWDRAGSYSCLTHWKSLWKKDRLLCKCASTVKMIVLNQGSKTAHFHIKMDHRWETQHGTCLIEHQFALL